jgi:hypothetical protein
MKRLKPKQITTPTHLETTQQSTPDSLMVSLVNKHINRLYPVEKVKYENKFRRCVYLYECYRPVSDVKKILIQKIILNIIETFDLTKLEAKNITQKFFKLSNSSS